MTIQCTWQGKITNDAKTKRIDLKRHKRKKQTKENWVKYSN